MKFWYHPAGRFSRAKDGTGRPDRFDVICESRQDRLDTKAMINAGILLMWCDDARVGMYACSDQASGWRLWSLIELMEICVDVPVHNA